MNIILYIIYHTVPGDDPGMKSKTEREREDSIFGWTANAEYKHSSSMIRENLNFSLKVKHMQYLLMSCDFLAGIKMAFLILVQTNKCFSIVS